MKAYILDARLLPDPIPEIEIAAARPRRVEGRSEHLDALSSRLAFQDAPCLCVQRHRPWPELGIGQSTSFRFSRHGSQDFRSSIAGRLPHLVQIREWLNAGVMTEGSWSDTGVGSPQGAIVRSCLANVFLHYVLDLWFHKAWRPKVPDGQAIIVRYADDIVVGFQYKRDAEQYLRDVRERLDRFGLSLHPDKTRLVEFGRFAMANRRDRGAGRPETFDFPGFTHFCTKTRRGNFRLGRKPVARTLARIEEVLRKRWHHDIWEVGAWLGRVCQGWLNYYAAPGRAGGSARSAAGCNVCGCTACAAGPSATASVGSDWSVWPRYSGHARRSATHGRTSGLPSNTRGRSRMEQRPNPDPCGVCAAMRIPTATVLIFVPALPCRRAPPWRAHGCAHFFLHDTVGHLSATMIVPSMRASGSGAGFFWRGLWQQGRVQGGKDRIEAALAAVGLGEGGAGLAGGKPRGSVPGRAAGEPAGPGPVRPNDCAIRVSHRHRGVREPSCPADRGRREADLLAGGRVLDRRVVLAPSKRIQNPADR